MPLYTNIPTDSEVLSACQRRAKNGELPTDAALVASKVEAVGCVYVWTLILDSELFDRAKADEIEAWYMAAKDKRLNVPSITLALAPLVERYGAFAVLAELVEHFDEFEKRKAIELQQGWIGAEVTP